jgi:malto-oligosyltrehalose trehalohydrolase
MRPVSISATLMLASECTDCAGRRREGGFGAHMMKPHRKPQGADVVPGGGVRFRLWAPNCGHVAVETRVGQNPVRAAPMVPTGDGWHELLVPDAGAGTRYQYVLPDGMRVPDPASRFQPDDVHGPSEVIDPRAYVWRDTAWIGRPWHEAVLYELHVGAFTSAGTFRAARERLDHLVTLGVTGIEIMPVADFPGRRNWGYDGVLLYAPDSSYGRPEDLMGLVDAAHARGIMVLLDVVYNHFGPDGNYLPLYAPAYFTERHKTPWGAGVNFDGQESKAVREFIIHNALYWIEEFHIDGLRLDAVHAILDDSPYDVLDELAERVRAGRRDVHLVLENEANQTRRLARDPHGRTPHYTAQWNDDVHHVLHVAATGEDQGYYAEYVGDTRKLGRALAEGFAFQGEMMEYRGGPRGEPSGVLPPTAFVAFIQNHDQIGNRAFGDRLTAIAPPEAMRALAAVYLLLPQVPMLFMGEEWHAGQPFPFFCDFDGELADAVRKGRRQEFARFPEFQGEAARERIPDPQSDSTFASAKLDWSDLEAPEHGMWFDLYRRLLATRREVIVPLLPGIGGHAASYEVLGPSAVAVRWQFDRGGEKGVLTLAANLSNEPVAGVGIDPGRTLWQEGSSNENGVCEPWSVRWSQAPRA